MRMLLELLTFDANKTIIELTRSPGHFYCELARNVGVNITDDAERKLTQTFEPALDRISKEYPSTGLQHNITLREFWTKVVNETFSLAQVNLNEREQVIVGNQAFDQFATKKCWRVKDDAVDVLNEIRKKFPSLGLGVISNGDGRLNGLLDDLGFGKFDFVIDSHSFGHAKPSKEIFDEALRRVSLTDASRAMHVGDEMSKDYLGAKNAGWRAIHLGESEQVPKDEQIDRISQLLEIIN